MGQSSKAQDNYTPKTDQILRQQHYPNHSYSTTVLTTSRKKLKWLTYLAGHITTQKIYFILLNFKVDTNSMQCFRKLSTMVQTRHLRHTQFSYWQGHGPSASGYTSRRHPDFRSMEVNSISKLHPHPLNSEHNIQGGQLSYSKHSPLKSTCR